LSGASLVAPLLGVPLFLLSGTASAVCTLAGNVLTCTGTTPGWVGVSNGGTINNSGEIAKLGDGTWGIYTGANITVNNTGTISGTSGVVLGGNAVINNNGGIIRSTDRAIQVTGGPVTLTNSNGGIIEGLAGALIYGGGTIVNTGNSRITSTGNYLGLGFGGGSVSITNTLGSTISGPASSIYGQATSITLDNGGLLQGNVSLDDGLVQRVTLRVGSRISGELYIGSKTGSTLTLTGAGTQIYSQAATGTTTFGGDLIKEDSGDWVINRSMAPRTATVNAGALGFATGGTFGAGTSGHFGAELFGEAAGFQVEPVHYRTTGDAVTAILSGDVAAAFVSTALGNAQIKGGKMRALATTAPRRSPLLPEVPTMAESGYPKIDISSWFALMAPQGTPPAILDLLGAESVKAVQPEDARAKLVEAGFSIVGAGRTDTDRMLREEAARWAAVVKASGFRGD
jgi:fibronectin-binding autotransporter adhesin